MGGRFSQPGTTAAANLLMLADGRFPAGGYAHSAGIEQAVERGRLNNEDELHSFLRGSLTTVGLSTASFAAAACANWPPFGGEVHGPRLVQTAAGRAIAGLAVEESARMPSPALREASRAQGRQLLRAAASIWPDAPLPTSEVLAALLAHGPHLSMAQGIVAAALELGPADAALLSAYAAVTGPAAAAVKLLGLDPFAVNRVCVALWPEVSDVVEAAADYAWCDPADLPCAAAPLLEIGAEHHAVRQPRMFAS